MPPERRTIALPPSQSLLRQTSPTLCASTQVPITPFHLDEHHNYRHHRHHHQHHHHRHHHHQQHGDTGRQHKSRIRDSIERIHRHKSLGQLQQAHEEYHRQRLLHNQRQRQRQQQQQQELQQKQQQSQQSHHNIHFTLSATTSTASSPSNDRSSAKAIPTASDLTTPYYYPACSSQFLEGSVRKGENARLQSRNATGLQTSHAHRFDDMYGKTISHHNHDMKRNSGSSDTNNNHHSNYRNDDTNYSSGTNDTSTSTSAATSSTMSFSQQHPFTMTTNDYSTVQPFPVASPHALAKENLRLLSQRIQQRRARARAAILYDFHQGVRTVEEQVHKRVDIVLNRLKEAPGSRYAFAWTNSLLAQLPASLAKNKGLLLSSRIAATMRGDNDDDVKGDEEMQDETKNDSEREENSVVPRENHHHNASIASTSSSSRTCTTTAGSCQQENTSTSSHVSLSSLGASEILAASQYHSFSIACSQVLNAALPSFLPSMVAPLVCVFSYPTPPPSSSSSSPSSPSSPSSSSSSSSSLFEQQTMYPHDFNPYGHESTAEPTSKRSSFIFPWGIPGDPSTFSTFSNANNGSSTMTATSVSTPEKSSLDSSNKPSISDLKQRGQQRRQQRRLRRRRAIHTSDKDQDMFYADEDSDAAMEEDLGSLSLSMNMEDESEEDDDEEGYADDERESIPTVGFESGDHQNVTQSLLKSRMRHFGYPQHRHEKTSLALTSPVFAPLGKKSFKKERMMNKRFALEEIPIHI
ncbi:hypothetical protein BGZ94_003025 [Podila epigama]|nr:hypothetical protein BGZ94_003025 [Podila epigama]